MLVGRERERALVSALLRRSDVRLLTLLGAGGVGKTRLALAVAQGLLADFPSGITFIDLASIADPLLVLPAIAGALQLRASEGESLKDCLTAYFETHSELLILDNFEQLLSSAPLVASLLAASPALKILVTSRAALRISAEHEFPVPPLQLPEPSQMHDLAAFTRTEAVSLFLQRARAAKPEFEVTSSIAPALAELCARLDGLPLAIELAAARVKLLSRQMMLNRLGPRLALLSGGAQDLPARQQTLRATFDWSYALLGPDEQALFASLAIFVGGFSLPAVEAMWNVTDLALDTLDGLTMLVDKSLLRQVDGPGGDPRFSMLETIREYAVERLDSCEDAQVWRQRHAEYFRALAEQAAPELNGPRQSLWLEQLEHEIDNPRAAINWALASNQPALGLGLAAALAHFWAVRNHLADGQVLLDRLLERWPNAPVASRAEALSAAGYIAYCVNQFERAAALQEQSLTLRRTLADARGLALSLHQLGRVEHYREHFDRADALYKESLAVRREHGDHHGIALTLNSIGVLALDRGDDALAHSLFEQSLQDFRALGDTWGIATALNNLARVARNRGGWASMIALCTESLALFQDLRDSMGSAWVMRNLMVSLQRREHWEQAATLHGASEALRETMESRVLSVSPSERATYDAAVAETRARLGSERFQYSVSQGRLIAPTEVLSIGLENVDRAAAESAHVKSRSATSSAFTLTAREREVAALVARGYTDRHIAEELVITEGTVGVHLTRIFNKLGLHARAELAVWVAKHGINIAQEE
ncbi:MAG: ATP-binding protein [Chloroflexota bacterium]